ncbi:MAG TPA: GspH/FimT family pseudopilin [Methylibium sp.]|nr:GspH/FimT family pseudopilin [Methylibium sp.]
MIELLMVVVLTAIVLVVVVPGFGDLLERRRVEGVANDLSTDMQYARSESVSRRVDVALTTAADGLSYQITGIPVTKTVTLPTGITVTASTTLTYTALRGIPNQSDVTINVTSTRTAAEMRLISNFMGRVQLCSPSGSLKGYTTC